MPGLGYEFDPETAQKDERSFDPLPNGWYAAQIIESDVAPTKAGTGTIATFTWEITDGPFSNRRLWQRINVQNANATAQEIGQRDLRSICDAVGVGRISETEVLHFKPVQIRVGRQKDDQERNEVKAVKGHGSQPVASPAQGAQTHSASPPQQQQRQAAAGGTRPWR